MEKPVEDKCLERSGDIKIEGDCKVEAKKNCLRKKEILSSKKDIDLLIKRGKWRFYKDFKYCYDMVGNGLFFDRILLSVPKRLFKRAVKRNLLKRRMRESYRQQKNYIHEGKQEVGIGSGIDILFAYNSKNVLGFQEIDEQLRAILKKINEER